MNFIDAILFQCRRQPPVAAICVPGQDRGLISYRRLERSIHNISRRLLPLGLAPGSTVAVNIQDVIFHAAVLLALARLGLATLSVHDSALPLPFKLDALITDAKPPAATAHRVTVPDPSWMEGDGEAIEPRDVTPTSANDICRLVLTSGSAGTPNAVAISQRLLSERIGRHLTVFGNRLPRCDRFYCHMPLATSLGFQFLIYSLMRGGTIVFPGERFDATLLAIEEYKVQCLMASPEGLETFLQGFDSIPAYQSNIELILCCRGAPAASLPERVRSRICSHVVEAYDSTEASILASAPAHAIAKTPGAVGFVTPGTTVQIVDRSGTVLPAGQEGLVRIKSDCAVEGYLDNSEQAARAFRDGWFYPGVNGTLDADALLVITGRQH
jgi:acyl-CoA synthetase (AMP-forming)/AMP-acid ligase II